MALALQLREKLKSVVDRALARGPDSKVMLLSCIDLRYPHRIIDTMDSEGYRGKYYHLSMAGASHAAKHDAAWRQAFADHLAFAVTHGHVTGVVILDHLDCRAYQLYEGVPAGDVAAERLKHIEVATRVVADIVTLQPSLQGHVEALLLPVEPEPIRPEVIGQS